VRRIARSLGIDQRGEQLVATLQQRIARVNVGAPVTVACVEWMEPLMPAGYWTPELIDLAGGLNLQWSTWDELVSADPDVIVIAPCGFDLRRTEQEAHFMTDRPGWSGLRGRKFLADGNAYFNRPGPRVVETHRILCEMLHPDRYSPLGCGTAWRAIS
jgi:iron complex transport system substrate-binding protein